MYKGLSWAEAFARGLLSTPPLNSHEEATGYRGATLVYLADDGTFQPVPRDPDELRAETLMMQRRQAVLQATADRIARHRAQLREIGER